jgi:hypothetical protein
MQSLNIRTMIIDYQRTHALMIEVLLSNKNSPNFENFIEVRLLIFRLYSNITTLK